jgi:hypothetical protein
MAAITGKLEKLIHQGFARYCTFNAGSKGINIKIPTSQTFVITRIDYFPFLDLEDSSDTNLTDQYDAMNKTLKVLSGNDSWSFNFRSYFATYEFTDQSANTPQGGFYQVPVYLVCTNQINVNVSQIPTAENWTGAIEPSPVQSDQPGAPIGYGTGADIVNATPIVQIINFEGGTNTEVKPYPDHGSGAEFVYTNFQAPSNGLTVGPQIPTGPIPSGLTSDNIKYPLYTLHGVLISQNGVAKFK